MKRFLILSSMLFSMLAVAQPSADDMQQILYGVAYYPEYMPEPRLEEDIALMKVSGINLVRVAESTWGYQEPADGEFNLGYWDEVLDKLHAAGIRVIVGTPTYAMPTWLAKKHPKVLVETRSGKELYGRRQNMDITHPVYRYYAGRMIRKLMEKVSKHPAVIGFQIDNETKHYDNWGANAQALFLQHLKDKFKNPQAMNKAYGLHYWSNSVNSWEDMPAITGSINGSLVSAFKQFQRSLVTDFLQWQYELVREYALPEQFVTQNFDLSWRDGSYSIQSNVDHMEAARHVDIAGIDIYHDTQDELDGVSIALAGGLARSMKQNNYLVIETQAQSILTSDKQKLHYPGQLRLQAYSHLASGANMVGYWHWHSIHNSYETYWKGVLSHDMQPNPTYHEVARISKELKRLNDDLIGLKKHNEVAIYFSNESLSALELFPISSGLDYGDIVRQYYELLYEQNIPCDFIDHTVSDGQLSKYKALIVPPLYSASDEELNRLNRFVAEGGYILYSFKSGFTDENVQVRRDLMPGVLREVVGANYQQFNSIEEMPLLVSENDELPGGSATHWMELLTPTNGEVLATYQHDYWGDYAAIVSNTYGKGEVTYLGTWPSGELLSSLLMRMMKRASVKSPDYAGAPVTVRTGTNRKGKNIVYLLNYSNEAVNFPCEDRLVRELISGNSYRKGELLEIAPWDLMILEQSK